MAGQQGRGNEAPNVGSLPNIDTHIQGFMGQHRYDLEIRRRFGFHEWLQTSEHPYSFLRSFTVRISKPGARAMPPLTGEASRFAPRATGLCIDERISHSGRSRSAKSSLPCQGSGLAASLAPRSGLYRDRCTQPSLKLPGCLMRLWLFHFRSLRVLCWVEKQGSVGVPLPTSDQKSDLQARVRSANTPLSFVSRVKLQSEKRVLRNLYQRGATPLGFSTVYCISFSRGEQAPH